MASSRRAGRATGTQAGVDLVSSHDLRRSFGVSLSQIGSIIDGMEITAVAPDGSSAPLPRGGWDHFRA